MSKVLITGGAGFIGSNFVKFVLGQEPDAEIVVLDALTYCANRNNLKDVADRIRFVHGDVRNRADVEKAIAGCDTVVHFAAESIPEHVYLPVTSAIGTRMMTFGELWNQQKENNKVQKTEKGEIIFLRGKQTKVLSFLNIGHWLPIKAITRHWYKGKIVKLNQKWGCIEATPNHSIYSADLKLVTGVENPELLVVRNVNENNKKYKTIDKRFLEIMAAYITEGNATFNKANGSYIVEFGQKNKEWLEKIGELIKKVFGLNYNVVKGKGAYHLQVSNKEFYNYLIKSCGKYSNGKCLPDTVFDLNKEDKDFFWKKLLEGDGTKDGRYTTTSYKLASQISLLLTLLGKKFTVFERNHPKYKRSWEFKTDRFVHHGLNQRKIILVDYEGWVYDVEVEKTHNFVCGIGNTVCHNTHVDRSITDPIPFLSTDVLGTGILLDVARAVGVKRFLHVSSDEVYGSMEKGIFKEDSPFRPNSPYSASKAGADHLVRAFRVTYGMPVLTVRPSNNYGPNQHPEKMMPRFVTDLLRGKKVPLYGEGLNVRDWLYVDDCCAGIYAVLQKGELGEAYNLGGECEKTNIEVTKAILEQLGKDEEMIEHVKDRPGHDFRYALDNSKIRKLGWAPTTPFYEGLHRTVEWYKANRGWWEPLVME